MSSFIDVSAFAYLYSYRKQKISCNKYEMSYSRINIIIEDLESDTEKSQKLYIPLWDIENFCTGLEFY